MSKIAISQSVVMLMVVMLLTAYLNMAEGASTTPAPETPKVGETVIRETEPLGGTTAEDAIVVPPKTEVTPEGKVEAGSTSTDKTEERPDTRMDVK